ncbi:hypothetical protein B0J14DRAFT_656180 [Halenospora varia]|nr:hypothetical protein B0J14DRAFT_656180 [Halenospora varia]
MRNSIAKHHFSLICLALTVLGVTLPYDASPFDIFGSVTGMSLNVGSNMMRGGTVSVDGITYTASDNLMTTTGTDELDCVINDPTGRYGPAFTGNPLFTADPDNPRIHATNGFPLCISRNGAGNDPLCPNGNRSGGATPQTTFTFGDPSKPPAGNPNNLPDARLMVALRVGDYVTITGTLVGGTLQVNALNANLGIFTAPRTNPAYVTVEEAIWGVVTPQAGLAGEQAETREVAWCTDPEVSIDWIAMDQDSCSDTFNRARYRLGKTTVNTATKQVLFRISPATPAGPPRTVLTGNNITAATPIIVGPLNPWPGGFSGAANPSGLLAPCPPFTPSVPSPTPTASTAPLAPAPAKDVITSVTATGKSGKGVVTVTVAAHTSDPNSKLSVSLAGANPVAKTAMTDLSKGDWVFIAQVKPRSTIATVTSDHNADPVTVNVI